MEVTVGVDEFVSEYRGEVVIPNKKRTNPQMNKERRLFEAFPQNFIIVSPFHPPYPLRLALFEAQPWLFCVQDL